MITELEVPKVAKVPSAATPHRENESPKAHKKAKRKVEMQTKWNLQHAAESFVMLRILYIYEFTFWPADNVTLLVYKYHFASSILLSLNNKRRKYKTKLNFTKKNFITQVLISKNWKCHIMTMTFPRLMPNYGNYWVCLMLQVFVDVVRMTY